jgi:hypothetical protein
MKDRALPRFRVEALRMEVEQLYPLASRVASHVQKCNAKGYSRIVRLYPLASREMSNAEYRSIQAYCFTLTCGESSPCHLFPLFLTPAILGVIVTCLGQWPTTSRDHIWPTEPQRLVRDARYTGSSQSCSQMLR